MIFVAMINLSYIFYFDWSNRKWLWGMSEQIQINPKMQSVNNWYCLKDKSNGYSISIQLHEQIIFQFFMVIGVQNKCVRGIRYIPWKVAEYWLITNSLTKIDLRWLLTFSIILVSITHNGSIVLWVRPNWLIRI